MTITATAHIVLDDSGVAWIDETRVKVLEVVRDQQTRGWSPDEIHFQHPHLSLAQIHAALSFYHDHADDIDRQLRQREEIADRLRAQQGDTAVLARLRAGGHVQ